MIKKKTRVIVLTHGGAERFLELVAALPNIEIAGVFVETVTERNRTLSQKLSRSIRYDGFVSTFKKFAGRLVGAESDGSAELTSVRQGQNDLAECAERLSIPLFKIEDYHSENGRQQLREADADLGVLYGTNIVKDAVFSIPRLGSINLHQGLAPIYRGGPSVFWELFNDEKEIGITVHFVASAVDAGDIVLQQTLPLEYDFSRYALRYDDFLRDFRQSLKEPSARLLVEAVRQIADGEAERTTQDTSLGTRYKLPTKSEKDQLLRLLIKRRSR